MNHSKRKKRGGREGSARGRKDGKSQAKDEVTASTCISIAGESGYTFTYGKGSRRRKGK